ncbi:MAG: hypothetical protein QNJ18_00830 [Xenococcaceae cyanobacterium MO_167.B52]|nr:hypothetical protein [Xenococcaceae cyanobacterium MO_167.B52]
MSSILAIDNVGSVEQIGDGLNIVGDTNSPATVSIQGNSDDTVVTGKKNDVVFTGGGNDIIFGGEGGDLNVAGEGDDVLFGGDGADVIIGGKGSDIMSGGEGEDIFVLDANDFAKGEADRIMDFTVGEDIVQINGIDPTKVTLDGNEVKFGDQTIINLVGDINDIQGVARDEDTFELF